ncbi:MAG: amidase, partial [Chloroflexi bacterium]|nr:amidase [Chloroflexota bacterium]
MPSPSTSSGQTGGLPYDRLGAFCRENHAVLPGAGQGPLAGLTFAAKDVFDIAGSRIGFGNPAWLESHPPAAITAPAVQLLLDAGADMAGKTLTDEITYSLSGQNFHYGTPVNSAAPGRIPGGSSSGSASAVAGGLVDFALGTDCGGSVRLPASYCGILGIRPSHGRVSLEGVAPFTWSFDVAGWFARDADVFASVGDVLLDDESESHTPRRLLYALDAFDLVDRDVADALAPAVEAAAGVIGSRADITISPDGLPGWYETFRVIQAWEIWSNHA